MCKKNANNGRDVMKKGGGGGMTVWRIKTDFNTCENEELWRVVVRRTEEGEEEAGGGGRGREEDSNWV